MHDPVVTVDEVMNYSALKKIISTPTNIGGVVAQNVKKSQTLKKHRPQGGKPKLSSTARHVASVYNEEQFPAPYNGIETILVGRCNAGKSTLINAVLRTNLARTSPRAGLTPCLNIYQDERWRIIDSPGYGVKGTQWQRELTLKYMERPGVKVVLVLDGKTGVARWDSMVLDELIAVAGQHGCAINVVISKLDKIKESERSSRIKEISQQLDDWVLGGNVSSTDEFIKKHRK